METNEGRRRSLRKREGKSYAEFGEADFIIEDNDSVPTSPLKGARDSGGATSTVIRPNHHNSQQSNSNGDVEMESEDDSEDDGPLEPLPLPKVRPIKQLFYEFLMENLKRQNLSFF